jgi:hypothetical protein
MDEEIQKPEPKISDVEIILIGLFYLFLDAIDFIPAAGDITDVIAAPMGFYYWQKGLNGITFIVAEIIEAIPGLQEFPFIRIITWGITVVIDRSPKLQASLATVEAVEGALDTLEGAGAAGAEGISERGIAAETTTPRGEAGQGSAAQAPASGGNNRPSDENTERDVNKNETEGEREATSRGQVVQNEDEAPGQSDLGAGDQGKSNEEKQEDEKKEEAEKKLRQGAEILPEEEAMKADFPEEEALKSNAQAPQEQDDNQRKLDERYAREQAKFGGGRPQGKGRVIPFPSNRNQRSKYDNRDDAPLADTA